MSVDETLVVTQDLQPKLTGWFYHFKPKIVYLVKNIVFYYFSKYGLQNTYFYQYIIR